MDTTSHLTVQQRRVTAQDLELHHWYSVSFQSLRSSAVLTIFFTWFYNEVTLKPDEIAENLNKSAGFVPGIRPGEQTSRYIDKVMTRLTLIGGLYVTFVCLVPYIMTSAWDVKFYFGGTSLLIVVVVIMDFIVQVQSHLMSSQYESALKKANLKGFGQ